MRHKYKKFLKAAYINYEEDYCGSGPGTFTKPTITTPIIVITGTTAIIACAVSGVTIYYTLDGSTPTSSSTEYTGTITLTLSCTIKAIAVKPGMTDSAVAIESYIHYLTQWRLVGNSVVHTDEYLTQWKVSGNSVVDNNAILSCGDLGQDGKYHVKISNGVNVYDIALDEPLRKVNDVADTIEFPSSVEGKALVTRSIYGESLIEPRLSWSYSDTRHRFSRQFFNNPAIIKPATADTMPQVLCALYEPITPNQSYLNSKSGINISHSNNVLCLNDDSLNGSVETLLEKIANVSYYAVLVTPTTELVEVPQIAVSSTNTYTSANVIPYSSFTHTENKEIWSCGEYNATDGKYHILVQPQGGSIADIALTEPLRKVNNVADTIEFPSSVEGKALVSRNLGYIADMYNLLWNFSSSTTRFYFMLNNGVRPANDNTLPSLLCSCYNSITQNQSMNKVTGIAMQSINNVVAVYDPEYTLSADNKQAFKEHIRGAGLLYALVTPTTETIEVPQIEEADSYTCEISQGAKAVSWSSFETE